MKATRLCNYLALYTTFLISTFAASAGFGQTPGTGAITGVVSDPAGRLVVNASVQAVNEATQITRSAITTTAGGFRVPLLPPGMYAVTVVAAGFSTNTSHSIQVTVSETTSLNVSLVVAGVNQSVQVADVASVAEL